MTKSFFWRSLFLELGEFGQKSLAPPKFACSKNHDFVKEIKSDLKIPNELYAMKTLTKLQYCSQEAIMLLLQHNAASPTNSSSAVQP